MIKINNFIFNIFFFFFKTMNLNAKIKIKYKIGDEIITNIDILNEKKYLIFFKTKFKKIYQKKK